MDMTAPLQVIGVVRTAHMEPATTPIQAGLNRAEHGTIDIDDRYREGLDGLAEFDYAWLLTWLHRLTEPGRTPAVRACLARSSPDRCRGAGAGLVTGPAPAGGGVDQLLQRLRRITAVRRIQAVGLGARDGHEVLEAYTEVKAVTGQL